MQNLHITSGGHAFAERQRLAGSSPHPHRACSVANALWLDDQLAEALSWVRWATRAGSGAVVHPMAWRALGNVLLDMGCYGEAEQAYRWADPLGQDPAVCCNRSQAALGRGDFAEAWRLAETRLCRPVPPDGVISGPWWDGWPRVQQLTIWNEQGLGDTLQFVRWLPELIQGGRAVKLLVDPPLRRLLATGLRWMGPGLDVQARSGSENQLKGCHGSLLSLPWRLQQPQPPDPGPQGYLRLIPATVGLKQRCRPRVGLVWGAGRYLDGRVRERNYRRKSLLGPALAQFLSALEQRPLELVRLQVGPDRDLLEQQHINWADSLPAEADFLELAQALQQVDLLVCVDTAAAHLAGAMGKTAWVLLPWAAESRWQRGSDHTPWYSTLRLWRQPRHGDWDGLWPALLKALDGWINRWNSVS